MNEIYDDSYMEEDLEDLQWKYLEVEGLNTITELSRQLRTFLKFKEQIIKHRFRSSFTPTVNRDVTKFMKAKKDLREIASNFIQILKEIRKDADSVEQGIQYHVMNLNNPSLSQLIEVTKRLFLLIHHFSEQEIHDHLRILKLLISLAGEACMVKKCLDIDLEVFYVELEFCYEELEDELEEMIHQKNTQDKTPSKKVLEERLRS